MGKTFAVSMMFLAGVAVFAQGGQGGGFGGGGIQGGQQGRISQEYDGSVNWIERTLGTYLNGSEVKNLMTPGEYSEWKLTLKAGQVVIAEAWSDAFDPALEIVDDKETVLASNDDRYPGDQRPVLFWRCEKDGEYAVRARCFADKFGGQFMFRSNVYKSVTAVEGGTVDIEVGTNERFLVRIPLMAGEIRRIAFERPQGFAGGSAHTAISPIGLPDIGLTAPLTPMIGNAVMASVDGDYYVLAQPDYNRGGKVRIKSAKQDVVAMQVSGSVRTGRTATNTAALWTLGAKAGELVEVRVPDLNLGGGFVLAERPDITKYDMNDEKKKNPFFPNVPVEGEVDKGIAFIELPGRVRDPRLRVFFVKRDCDLWLSSSGNGKQDSEYSVTVEPAESNLVASVQNSGRLRIGNHDYWAFDARAGDVMTFKARVEGFAQSIVVRGPDLAEVWSATAQPDQDAFDWNMIVSKPGRYLVAVSAMGDGAAGTYTLSREVFAARTFDRNTPAVGSFSTGETEIWKFTAKPDEPLLVHWTSVNRAYTVAVRDENGNNLSLPLTSVDKENQFGILKVSKEQTFVIVLISDGGKGDYKIELGSIPGFAPRT